MQPVQLPRDMTAVTSVSPISRGHQRRGERLQNGSMNDGSSELGHSRSRVATKLPRCERDQPCCNPDPYEIKSNRHGRRPMKKCLRPDIAAS
ncbi:MAG: hypothetical protein FE78DRAFT_300687 [Acidomyces sp. 'richmondensis']|nr:MAG: hypothetical protein FE78DRAFT_300687 [Acidomyces sp. 'richmondensis']